MRVHLVRRLLAMTWALDASRGPVRGFPEFAAWKVTDKGER